MFDNICLGRAMLHVVVNEYQNLPNVVQSPEIEAMLKDIREMIDTRVMEEKEKNNAELMSSFRDFLARKAENFDASFTGMRRT